ncbi:hypothetical protein B5M50_03125 [candidate division KSB1 bacterium 4484_219]|nr:MAG: hypothetical protein B5M50_03125 [candidate division KSB1 bacterium 4484_219]
MRRFLLYQFPAIVFAILIFVGSSFESLSVPEIGINWEDKIAHLIEYGIFGFLITRALYFYPKLQNSTKVFRLAITLALVYGITDELHQIFVPGRDASIMDWIADGVGVLIGGMLFRWWYPVERKVQHCLDQYQTEKEEITHPNKD